MIRNATEPRFDLHASSLLAATFSDPSEVLANPLLSDAEKRCVLAAWASDAFAVEGCPWLRHSPARRPRSGSGTSSPPCAASTGTTTRIQAAPARCIGMRSRRQQWLPASRADRFLIES